MKKSEIMGYLVYAILFAMAILVGIFVVRPIMTDYGSYAPMEPIVFLIVAIVVGIVLNAAFIELGHFVGAKIGNYKVYFLTCLWLGWKEKEGKMRFGAQGFDGFLGETKIAPKNDKSNPKPFIYMPLVFFLIEVIAGVVLIAISTSYAEGPEANLTWEWYKLLGIVILTCGGIVYVYDIFPAALDSKNDGYLLTVLTNKTNIEAYNDLLRAEYKIYKGEKTDGNKIYDKVTNFTSRINAISTAAAIDDGDYAKAIAIVDKTIACKDDVSSFIYEDACADKVSLLLLSGKEEEGRKEYISYPLEVKKHIASMSTPAAVRTYILVSGLIDESKGELEGAISKVDAVLKKGSEQTRASDTKLAKDAIKLVLERHPDWDLSAYNLNLGEEQKPSSDEKVASDAPEVASDAPTPEKTDENGEKAPAEEKDKGEDQQ